MIQVEIAATDPVTSTLLGAPVTTTLEVDSGADISVIDDGLAPTLGINLAALPTAQVAGVGGAYRNVPKGTLKMLLVGRWIDVPVLFMTGELLLGREAAFDAIHLAFVHKHGLLLAAAS